MVDMNNLNKALKQTDYVKDIERKYAGNEGKEVRGLGGRSVKVGLTIAKNVEMAVAKFKNYMTTASNDKKSLDTALSAFNEAKETLEVLNEKLRIDDLPEDAREKFMESKKGILKKIGLVLSILLQLKQKNYDDSTDTSDKFAHTHSAALKLFDKTETELVPETAPKDHLDLKEPGLNNTSVKASKLARGKETLGRDKM